MGQWVANHFLETLKGILKGPDSDEVKLKKKLAAQKRYQEHPELFHGHNKGMIAINNGEICKYINKGDDIPSEWSIGQGHHKTYVIKDIEAFREMKSIQVSGKNNPNYGHGERQSGGKNGKAIYDFYYSEMYFDCAKNLLKYIQENVDERFSMSSLRSIYNHTYGDRIQKKFGNIIQNLVWELKDENKVG